MPADTNQSPEKQTIKLAGIVRESIVDGPGIRLAVFCQGCPHHCPGCHNQEALNFDGGKSTEIEKILAVAEGNPLLRGVTFSGGEPLCQAEGFLALAEGIEELNRKRRQDPSAHPGNQMDITVFTGYTYEELMAILEGKGPETDEGEHAPNPKALRALLDHVDLLIEGRYVEAERDLTLKFRGSRNQRILDMKKTRQKGEPVLANEYME